MLFSALATWRSQSSGERALAVAFRTGQRKGQDNGSPTQGALRTPDQKLPINQTLASELAPIMARCRPSGDGKPHVSFD